MIDGRGTVRGVVSAGRMVTGPGGQVLANGAVLYDGDPLTDLAALRSVRLVVAGGRVVSPLPGAS
ncbi:hypothetical protein ACFV30_15790 [Streptomyces sp. NPDC059752]|uniref:hypothetical protein n=1 Tax=unclassified Streptomyces TaxID=2593676 RepID=UPI00365D275B